MNCPKCNTETESGAAFCGNCGQALANPVQTPGIPHYAIATPQQHKGETKALLSLLFGIVGIAGALFMALIGLVLGTAGLVMGTMSRSSPKRSLSNIGLVLSSLAIVSGLAAWAYTAKKNLALNNTAEAAQSSELKTELGSELLTSCYSVGFAEELSITYRDTSCDMSAHNGRSLTSSTTAYKIYASKGAVQADDDFKKIAKKALHKDLAETLPDFEIDKQEDFIFAGSPAYAVYASNASKDVSVVEAAVFHETSAGQNIFILVNAVQNDKASLQTLEAQWQWK